MEIYDKSIYFEQNALHALPTHVRKQLTRMAKRSIRSSYIKDVAIQKRVEIIRAEYHMKVYQCYGYVSREFSRECNLILEDLLEESTKQFTSHPLIVAA